MPNRIETLPSLHLVGLEIIGHREELARQVPTAWTQLVKHLDGCGSRAACPLFYGAMPERDHTQGETYTYWVGAVLDGRGEVPPGMAALTIPAQTYAVKRVHGPAGAIEAAYRELAEWIASSDWQILESGWALERYDESRQKVTPPYTTFDYDILKPVSRRP